MAIDKRAGQPAQQSDLINVAQLTAQYYVLKPEVGNAEHAVKFGTSGHRGSAARHNFNEPHILAIAQAIAEDRAKNGITGPCYVGKDTHALSEPAFISVLEVLTANGVDVIVQENNGFTPTPAVSNAILVHNKKGGPLADGIVIAHLHGLEEVPRLVRIIEGTRGLRCYGAAALEMVEAATGRAGAVVHTGLQPWDVAAGALLCAETGVVLTRLDGEELDVREPGSLLAGTPSAHAEMIERLVRG